MFERAPRVLGAYPEQTLNAPNIIWRYRFFITDKLADCESMNAEFVLTTTNDQHKVDGVRE